MIRKIIYNRILILQTSFLLCKYLFMRTFLSGKVLLKKLSTQEINKLYYHTARTPEQPFHSVLRSINRILEFLYPNGNCLVRSLVKREVLKKYGYPKRIAVGVIRSELGIKAHAWISGENDFQYNIVHLL